MKKLFVHPLKENAVIRQLRPAAWWPRSARRLTLRADGARPVQLPASSWNGTPVHKSRLRLSLEGCSPIDVLFVGLTAGIAAAMWFSRA